MKANGPLVAAAALAACAAGVSHSKEATAPGEVITMDVWPDAPPGEVTDREETELPARGDRVTRVTNVASPGIAVYRPGETDGPAPAVMVCPGGGYNILAWNLEGTEVAEWLRSIGFVAVVLKYRVPKNRAGAFQDAQRAMRVIRSRAEEWGVDPGRVGVLGFSAGGHLSARLSTGYGTGAYEPVDEIDKQSSRPDFAVLVYPAYLAGKAKKEYELAPELTVTRETPPTFIVQTQDDRRFVAGSVAYYVALRKANVPAEIHLFPTGGHGYGLRPSEHAVSGWPALCETWLETASRPDPPRP